MAPAAAWLLLASVGGLRIGVSESFGLASPWSKGGSVAVAAAGRLGLRQAAGVAPSWRPLRPLAAAAAAAAEGEGDVDKGLVSPDGGDGGPDASSPPPAKAARSPEAQRLAMEAERYKLQAEKLRLEAEKERLILDQERLKKKEILVRAQDAFIAELRSQWNRGEGVGEGEKTSALAELVKSNVDRVDTALFLRLADLAEATSDLIEREELILVSQEVMRTVEEADPGKAAELSDSIRKSLQQASGVKAKKQAGPGSSSSKSLERAMVQQWVDATMSQNVTARPMGSSMDGIFPGNITMIGGPMAGNWSAMGLPGGVPNVVLLPLWVPPALLSFATSAPEIKDEDTELLKKEVFGIDSFYVTGVEKSPFALLFRGNMRGQESKIVFDLISKRLAEAPDGLSDRIQLFFMEDPSPRLGDLGDEERGADAKPVFIALSKQARRSPPAIADYGLSLASFAVTAFTSFAYSIGTLALNSQFFDKLAAGDLSTASRGVPVTIGIMGMLIAHDLAHRAAAKMTGAADLGAPVFIPSLQMGAFGSITPLGDFPDNRNQLFDISTAGPLVGALLSVGLLGIGLALTGEASASQLANFPVLPAGLFHSSLLVGLMSTVLLPSAMLQMPFSTPIPAHPLVIIGVIGALVNALNLMPIGRLDGGRAASAVFGRRPTALLGTLTLLLQAVSAVFNNYSIQLFWGLVVILFQRGQDLPARDEVTPTNEGRGSLLIALLAFSLLTLLPFPNVLQ